MIEERRRLPLVLIGDRGRTRMAIRQALEGEVDICGEFGTASETIRAARQHQPELCLVGTDLPGGWLLAVRRIRDVAAGAAVVVLAERRDVDDLLAAVRAGATAYLPGAPDTQRLLRVVRAAGGEAAMVPRSLILELILDVRGGPRDERLTDSEGQVLSMLRRGHTTSAIAETLDIAPTTVRRHVAAMVHKLGLGQRQPVSASLEKPFPA